MQPDFMGVAMQEIQLWTVGLISFMTVVLILLLGQVTRLVVKMDQIINYVNVLKEKEEE